MDDPSTDLATMQPMHAITLATSSKRTAPSSTYVTQIRSAASSSSGVGLEGGAGGEDSGQEGVSTSVPVRLPALKKLKPSPIVWGGQPASSSPCECWVGSSLSQITSACTLSLLRQLFPSLLLQLCFLFVSICFVYYYCCIPFVASSGSSPTGRSRKGRGTARKIVRRGLQTGSSGRNIRIKK